MRVIVVMPGGASVAILLSLDTSRLISEIMELVAKGKHTKAMLSALSHGRFEKEVDNLDADAPSADLILFNDSARWDLKR